MSSKTIVKTSRISSKGQITLPRSIMYKLGLKYGDLVDISDKDKTISISPKKNMVENILSNLRKNIKIPANLLNKDLDKSIKDAKKNHYKTKKI